MYRRISLILFLLSVINKSFSADFNIEEIAELSPLIDETSGLASHGNFLYTINDSGNSNMEIFYIQLTIAGILIQYTNYQETVKF